jgi:hypothetical protein
MLGRMARGRSDEMVELALDSSRHRWRQFADQFTKCLAHDRLFFLLIILITQVAAGLAFIFHRTYLDDIIEEYLLVWTLSAGIGLGIVFAFKFFLRAIRERPERPLHLAADVAVTFLSPDRLAGLVRYYALAIFMGAFTTIKTMLPLINPFWADPWLSSIDRFIHFGNDPWRIIHPLLGHQNLTQIIEFIYSPVWLSCLMIFVLYFSFTTSNLQHRRRVILAFILVWAINGAILAGLFMSGGPAFYGALTHDHVRYAGLMQYLSFDRILPFSATAEQKTLWALHVSGSSDVGAGISAFPSIHVSMMLLCCLAAWRVNRRFAYALMGLLVVIVFGAVHLAWHYAIGTYADFLFVPVIWRLSKMVCATPSSHETFQFSDQATARS